MWILINPERKGKNNLLTSGLLIVPSAPSNDLVDETPSRMFLLRRSNGTLDSDDFLDAGTPPPSYAEVLACISTPAVNEVDDTSVRGTISQLNRVHRREFILRIFLDNGNESSASAEWRNSLRLPNERTQAEVAIQRFSLQLALDCSDTSSCTSSSSHAQPLSTSSSSSAASIAHLGSNWVSLLIL